MTARAFVSEVHVALVESVGAEEAAAILAPPVPDGRDRLLAIMAMDGEVG